MHDHYNLKKSQNRNKPKNEAHAEPCGLSSMCAVARYKSAIWFNNCGNEEKWKMDELESRGRGATAFTPSLERS